MITVCYLYAPGTAFLWTFVNWAKKKRITSLLAHQQFNVKMETILFTFYVMFETVNGNWKLVSYVITIPINLINRKELQIMTVVYILLPVDKERKSAKV